MEAKNEGPAGGAPLQASPYVGTTGVVQGQNVAHGPGDGEPSEKIGPQGPASQRRVEGASESESPDDGSDHGWCRQKKNRESSSAH